MNFLLEECMLHGARLLAEGTWSDGEIAEPVGIQPFTLENWRADSYFRELVRVLAGADAPPAPHPGITDKSNRLQRLDENYRKLEQIIDERAADPAMQDVPGGSTGLLIRYEHAIGAGRNAGRAVEYRVDVALLAEQRALLKQMAQEQSESTTPADELSGPRSRASLIILPEKHPHPVLIPPPRSSAESIDDAG